MDEKTKQRIEEIQRRLLGYFNVIRSPYLTYKGLMKAQYKFLEHAPEDIEFLLNEVRRLRVLRTLRHSPSRVAEKLKK